MILLAFILWLSNWGMEASLFLYVGECAELMVEVWLLYTLIDWVASKGEGRR